MVRVSTDKLVQQWERGELGELERNVWHSRFFVRGLYKNLLQSPPLCVKMNI